MEWGWNTRREELIARISRLTSEANHMKMICGQLSESTVRFINAELAAAADELRHWEAEDMRRYDDAIMGVGY